MYGANSGEFVCGSWGLKGYKTSPIPTPHLAGRTASERNEGKTFVRRRYVLCTNDDLLNLTRFTYIHCHVSFTFYVKNISVVKMITAASRIRTCAGEPHWISSHSAIAAPISD